MHISLDNCQLAYPCQCQVHSQVLNIWRIHLEQASVSTNNQLKSCDLDCHQIHYCVSDSFEEQLGSLTSTAQTAELRHMIIVFRVFHVCKNISCFSLTVSSFWVIQYGTFLNLNFVSSTFTLSFKNAVNT